MTLGIHCFQLCRSAPCCHDTHSRFGEEAREILEDAKAEADSAIREYQKWLKNPAAADARRMEERRTALRKKKDSMTERKERKPEVSGLSAEDFRDGQVDILTMLVKSGLVPSRSEARRAVEQGGVTVDGEKVADIHTAWTAGQIGDGLLLKRSKKNFKKIVVK